MAASNLAYSYVPKDRLHAMASHTTLPEMTNGSALFADISGFTILTESLAQSLGSRRGGEELTTHLNQVYDAVISEVNNYRGSVIGFSGDAITCWFTGDLENAAHRAVSCATQIQAQMKQFASVTIPNGETIELTIKVSIASGEARRFLLGNPSIQLIDALAGQTVFRVSEAGEVTEKGEIVVDQVTLDYLNLDTDSLIWRQGDLPDERFAVIPVTQPYIEKNPWNPLNLHELDPDHLAEWVLPVVYNRIKNNLGEFLTELRPASALFVRFDGIDYDQDDACGQKLNQFVSAVQHIIDKYDGVLIQLTIGDKGSYLYGSFGALTAHENDIERTVLSARDIVQLNEQLDFIQNIQIGISYGTMRTGSYGGSNRHTYGSLGNEVNIAARLMKAARYGEVIATKHIYDTTQQTVDWEILHPIKVKGIVEPLPVFRLTLDRKQTQVHLLEPRHYAPIFGRAEELLLINQKIDAAISGKGQVIHIVGEAGIGKSRLLAEIVQAARLKSINVFGGACESHGANISYLVWHQIWRSIFNITEADSIESLQQQLETIQPALVERMPLLSSILNMPIPDNSLTATLEPEIRKSALESMLLDVLRHHVQLASDDNHALMLILEDCHWIDPLSNDLLNRICRICADWSIIIVAAHRPIDDMSSRAEFIHGDHTMTLELTALNPINTERLIHDRLDQITQDDVSKALVTRIAEQSEGNPFFIEELINYLDVMNPSMSGIDFATIALPTSLHNLILSRIDQLQEHEKVTLKIASIIGRLFRVDWLFGYYSIHEVLDNLAATLNDIENRELIVLDQPEPHLSYLFKHIITREVAYESLPYAQRETLHEQLGNFIENLDAERYVDLLAYHFELSSNREKSMTYFQLAGEAAMARFANEEAVSYFTRLLQQIPQTNTQHRYEIYKLRETIFELQGERDKERLDIEAMENLAAELGDQTRKAYLALRWSTYHRKQGQFDQSLEVCESGIVIADQHNLTELKPQLLLEMGIVLWRQANYEQARLMLQQAADLSQDKPELHGACLRNLGVVAAREGNFKRANELSLQCLALFRDLNNKRLEGQSLHDIAIHSYELGDFNMALDYVEQALQVWRQIGDRYDESNTLITMGSIFERDEPQKAKECLRESLKIKKEINDRQHEVYVMSNLGSVAISEVEYEEALNIYQDAMSLAKQLGDTYIESIATVNAGLVSRHLGNYEEANTYLQQTIELTQQDNDVWIETYAHMQIAWCNIYQHYFQAGFELAMQIHKKFADMGDKVTATHAQLCAIEALCQINKYQEALALATVAYNTLTDANQKSSAIEALAYLAFLNHKVGNIDLAITQSNQVMTHLEEHSYHGLDEPMIVYLLIYDVIKDHIQQSLPQFISLAQSMLAEILEKIPDETLKQSFMDNVTYYQDLKAIVDKTT